MRGRKIIVAAQIPSSQGITIEYVDLENTLGKAAFYLLNRKTKIVWENRARYKVFHYQMANNSLITVLDGKLGFYLEDLEHLHQNEIAYCKFFVIDNRFSS